MMKKLTNKKNSVPEINELKEQLTEYKKLIDNLPNFICKFRPDGTLTYVNKSYADYFNSTTESLTGKNWLNFLLKEAREEAKSRLLNLTRSNPSITYEHQIIAPGGEIRWQKWTDTAIFDKLGNIIEYQSIGHDITEQKKAEQKLLFKNALLEAQCETTLDGILVVDNNGKTILHNKQFGEMWNIPADILKKKNDKEMLDFVLSQLKYPEKFIKKVEFLYIHKGKDSRDEIEFKDGKTFDRWSAPLIDTNGKYHGRIWYFQDLTAHKHAEGLLVEEKERLAVTLRSIGDGVITTDKNGIITLVNKTAEKITGWTQKKFIGQAFEEIFHIINERTGETCRNPVAKTIRTKRINKFIDCTLLIARDGTEKILSGNSSPIYDKNKEIIGVAVAFHDITDERKTEEELLKASKLESLGILAGGIAHDFNNLLTAIIGCISLAKMSVKPEEETFEILNNALNASMKTKDLTRQLLTFSKGGIPIKKLSSISDLIKDTVKFALRGTKVKCRYHIKDELWQVEVDQGQFSQVIDNLIINAVQAMPKGGTIDIYIENIMLESEESVPLKHGKYLKISIKDQGIGIPEEYLAKIFDPYFTTKQKGTGLGLATSYSIIKRHQGHISLESKDEIGATFFIYLPASDKKVVIREKEDKRVYNGKGRILLMDDEEIIRKIGYEMLEKLGYEIELARDGRKAVSLYEKARNSNQPFKAVIMDLTVPGGMGGIEAIKKLKKIDPRIKAIVSSGYSNDPIISDYEKHGFKGILPKPYQVEELGKILNKVITGQE